MASNPWIPLPSPPAWGRAERRAFAELARALTITTKRGVPAIAAARRACFRDDRPALAAAAGLLCDLVGQDWAVEVDVEGRVLTRPPKVVSDPAAEKNRVRKQELLKRDEQLAAPSVQRFIADMEKPREFDGRFVSIFSLMRDGQELRSAIEAVAKEDDPVLLRKVVDPYVQVVNNTDRCRHTGLRLGDIWRYFRHTWSNQYTSTPGRTMLVLVRVPCRAVSRGHRYRRPRQPDRPNQGEGRLDRLAIPGLC